MERDLSTEWVVVLELAQPSGLPVVDQDRIAQALAALADADPVALMGDGRYAVQLRVVADGPASALLIGLGRWRETTEQLFIPAWELVRAEVLTAEELEREYG